MKERRVEIRIAESDIKVGEIVAAILIIQRMNPEREVFMDGDEYAIVSQERS